jgi:hypothetical protein
MLKMYFKSVALACALFTGTVSAQTLVMSYYPEEKVVTKTHSSFTSTDNQLTEDADFVYEKVEQTLPNLKKLVIKKVSKATGKKVWEKLLPVDASNKSSNTYFCDLEKISNGFILFMKHENSKTKESYLTGQIFDENLRPYGEEEQVASIGFRGNFFYYKILKEGNHFLVYPSFLVNNEFKNTTYKFTMIDDKLSVTYEKEIEFEKNQSYQLHTLKLESNLSLKALFLVTSNAKEGGSKYYLANFNYLKSDLKVTSIETDNRFKYFGNDLADFESQTGFLIISGQYHKTKMNSGYEGIFNLKYNLNKNQLESAQLIEYPKNLIGEMIGDKLAQKGKLPTTYSIQNQYVDATSDVTYVLEDISSETVKGSSTTFDKTMYYHGKIIILKTNQKGEISWFKAINRSAADPYSTYIPSYSFDSKGNTILLFNASEASAKSPDQERGYLYSSFENVLVAMVFDQNGNIKSTDTFAPKLPKGKSCNMQTIRTIDDNTIEVSFDKVSQTYKLESTTRARLTLE